MFAISPSLIKKFFRKGNEIEYCPSRVMNTFISPVVEDSTSESQLYGQFFESLCIGRTRNGVCVNDLPRKKLLYKQKLENERLFEQGLSPIHLGEKTVDQIRIEQQSLVFKQLCKKYMMVIEDFNTQTEIRHVLNSEFVLVGHPDIFPTPILSRGGLRMVGIDLKLTIDTSSEFGDFCWGRPELMDQTQGWMYKYIINNIKPEENTHLSDILIDSVVNMCHQNEVNFYYWVYGYSPKSLNNKFVPVKYDKHAELETKELIRKTMSIVEFNDKKGWPAIPSYKVCNDCPLKTTCKEYDPLNQ